MFSQTDRDRMLRAVSLARRGLFTTHPNPRVGCLLVKDGRIIGEGWHKRAGLGHAEVEALADCQTNDKADPRGATAYVTLEPCSFHGKTPPCTEALLKAGVSRVIIGSLDPNPKTDSVQQLRDAGLEVQTGCEESACVSLNPGFFSRMQRNRPWVRVKMAMSLDGRTALANGVSQWISSAKAREDVQRWRAQSDCILSGIGTILEDDPQLNVRVPDEVFNQFGFGEIKQPLLAIADTSLRTHQGLKVFDVGREVVVYSASAEKMPFEVVRLAAATDGRVALQPLLEDLAMRQINEVHVEAGATLCASLVKERLADELLLYIAPHLLGADARGLFALTGLTEMAERCSFEFVDMQQIGTDLRVSLRPVADAKTTLI